MACINRSVLLVSGILMFSSFNVVAGDDYLKMLENEASDLELDQSGQINEGEQDEATNKDSVTKANWTWDGELEGNILPTGLAQNEFTGLLKQQFYGTFVFYHKLNSNDRQTVYYHYSKSPKPDIDDIRKDVTDHLKQ